MPHARACFQLLIAEFADSNGRVHAHRSSPTVWAAGRRGWQWRGAKGQAPRVPRSTFLGAMRIWAYGLWAYSVPPRTGLVLLHKPQVCLYHSPGLIPMPHTAMHATGPTGARGPPDWRHSPIGKVRCRHLLQRARRGSGREGSDASGGQAAAQVKRPGTIYLPPSTCRAAKGGQSPLDACAHVRHPSQWALCPPPTHPPTHPPPPLACLST